MDLFAMLKPHEQLIVETVLHMV